MVTTLPTRPPLPSVVHLPRQDEGTWYIAQSRFQINVVPIRQIAWRGDDYDFRTDIRFGPRAAFTLDVHGAVSADGSIRGDVTPVGVSTAPFSRTFEGTLRGGGRR